MKLKSLLGIVATAGLLTGQASAQSVNTLVADGLLEPHSVVVAGNGLCYVTDRAQNQVKEYTPATGVVRLLAGDANGAEGSADGTGIFA